VYSRSMTNGPSTNESIESGMGGMKWSVIILNSSCSAECNTLKIEACVIASIARYQGFFCICTTEELA